MLGKAGKNGAEYCREMARGRISVIGYRENIQNTECTWYIVKRVDESFLLKFGHTETIENGRIVKRVYERKCVWEVVQ